MSTPLVSLFVQAYNTERYIGECLESILALRGGYELEVLVIDDASSDNTARVAESFKDPRLRVIRHSSNRGAIATANEGYAQLRGQFVARIDSDDRCRPIFLEHAVPLLMREAAVGLVYGDIVIIDPEGKVTAAGNLVKRGGRPALGNELFPLLEENFIPAPATLMRREALQTLLPIPGDLSFLDWYLTTGIAERWNFYYVHEVLADYRIHTTNMHRTMVKDRSGEATVFKVLNRIFDSPIRTLEKRRHRRRIYACNYVTCADKYFGRQMNRDARRCYLRALSHQPSLGLNGSLLRRLLATLVPRSWYERSKEAVRRPFQERETPSR